MEILSRLPSDLGRIVELAGRGGITTADLTIEQSLSGVVTMPHPMRFGVTVDNTAPLRDSAIFSHEFTVSNAPAAQQNSQMLARGIWRISLSINYGSNYGSSVVGDGLSVFFFRPGIGAFLPQPSIVRIYPFVGNVTLVKNFELMLDRDDTALSMILSANGVGQGHSMTMSALYNKLL